MRALGMEEVNVSLQITLARSYSWNLKSKYDIWVGPGEGVWISVRVMSVSFTSAGRRTVFLHVQKESVFPRAVVWMV